MGASARKARQCGALVRYLPPKKRNTVSSETASSMATERVMDIPSLSAQRAQIATEDKDFCGAGKGAGAVMTPPGRF